MAAMNKVLFLFGYFLFVGPPRTLDLALSHRRNGGELERVPVWGVLLVEAMLRVVLFLLIAVIAEQLMGSYWYSWLEFDRSALIMLISGGCHMLCYYVLLYRFRRQLGERSFRLYRLFRNLTYAFLPGLPVVTVMLLVDGVRSVQQSDLELQLIVYSGVTALMLLIGFAEGLTAKRRPLGLDEVFQ